MAAPSTTLVDARPEIVYSILSDYESGHPAILPDKFFTEYHVEEGGIGEGTRIRFTFHLMGLKRTMQAKISEPDPGRLLMETDLETGAQTRFLVESDVEGV